MRFQETETVELKSIVMDDLKKEIIAFANCDGGTLYVGVADDGTLCLFTMKRWTVRERQLWPSTSSGAQTARIILQRKDCGPRASMCGRAILLSRQRIRPFGR